MATQKDGRNEQGAGSQHNDWGRNKAGNAEPAHEEAGELDAGLGGIGSLSTGHAGSLQSEREPEPAPSPDKKRPG
jgi:hypothetical protein